MKKLNQSFYTSPSIKVAKNLLGKILVRKIGNKILSGKIVEVETYRENDPASHSYNGKTKRNAIMFEKGGHLYVYFIYGMHFCANIVTGKKGAGEAVLVRAVEPLEGIQIMRKNRGIKINDTNLTNGPAKLCEAFGITRKQNGVSLLGNNIFLIDGETVHSSQILSSSRIGIKKGIEKQWRFFINNNPWVSKTKNIFTTQK